MPAIAMRACSACAGDYEDPGRTAGPDDSDDAGDADRDVSEYEVEWEGDPDGDAAETSAGGGVSSDDPFAD
jgi:hypothetical protein